MAGAFPTLTGGATVQYPLLMRVNCLTRVHEAANASRQRYAVRAPWVEIELRYTNLNATDRAAVETFFSTQKGAFDSTWTLTFDGKTFTGMRFLHDDLRWEETIPNRVSTVLRCAGFHPAITSPPSSFPALASGAIVQLPYAHARSFLTNYEDLETGRRHAVALRGGGLTNYPAVASRMWEVRLPSIRPSEAEAHVKFFISQHGRLGSFAFTDPDTGTAYNDSHYATDDIEVRYVGYNHCAIVAQVVN